MLSSIHNSLLNITSGTIKISTICNIKKKDPIRFRLNTLFICLQFISFWKWIYQEIYDDIDKIIGVYYNAVTNMHHKLLQALSRYLNFLQPTSFSLKKCENMKFSNRNPITILYSNILPNKNWKTRHPLRHGAHTHLWRNVILWSILAFSFTQSNSDCARGRIQIVLLYVIVNVCPRWNYYCEFVMYDNSSFLWHQFVLETSVLLAT